MAISEESRHRLHLRLAAVLGPDEAGLLMDYLPPVGWADVATKTDLEHLAALTKRDIDGLGTTLRLEMAQLEVGLRSDMNKMEVGLRSEISKMGAGISSFQWRMVSFMSAGFLTMAGLLVTRPHL